MGNKIEVAKLSEGLKFDPSLHRYTLDGTVCPSVTKIMQPLSSAMYGSINEDILRQAAEKGTAVHSAIESFLKFGFDGDIEEQYSSFYGAFKSWWNSLSEKPIVIGSEVKTYHRIKRYCGTIDFLAELNGKLTIMDFKTTANLSEMACGVQLEAYAQMLSSHGITVERKMILQLKKDGKFKVEEFPAKDISRLRVFDALKVVHDYIGSYARLS